MSGFSIKSLAVILAVTLPSASQAADGKATIEAPLGGFTLIHLNGTARHVVLGNPAIADVTVDNPRTVTVFGKRPGGTSLAVMDASGQVIFERRVFVPAGNAGTVTVRYGTTKAWTPGGTTTVVECSETTCAPAAALPTDSPYRVGGK